VEDLAAAPGMSAKAARQVFEFFHPAGEGQSETEVAKDGKPEAMEESMDSGKDETGEDTGTPNLHY
jgi:hypothetical protein